MTNFKPSPTYELKGDADLSKFILGAMRDVRKGDMEIDQATVIAQLADKYTRNEIMRCIKAKLTKQMDSLDLGAEINKQLNAKVEEEEDEEDVG